MDYTHFTLEDLGWNGFFSGAFNSLDMENVIPGRVVKIEKELCWVLTEKGELTGQLSGKMRFQASGAEEYPAIGDWLAVQSLPGEPKAIIHAILPRKTKFSRQVAGGRDRIDGGKTWEQIVAANVDTVFLVSSMDGGRGFSARRIERYLAIAWASGASPVIVLNKADLCPDPDTYIRQTERVAYDIPIHTVSAVVKTGLEELGQYLVKGGTVAFLGSSGVGKSALINALLGEERLATNEVRESDKEGRHTTTRRELVYLPNGAAVIDTPGMREIQVWGDEDSLDSAFADISDIAANCRFKDCRHDSEPGCAVREALRHGQIDMKHFKNYLQMQRELKHQLARQDGSAALEEKQRWKSISKEIKRLYKDREEY